MMLKLVLILISLHCLICSTSCQEYDTQTYINLLKTNRTFQDFYLPHLNSYVHYIDWVLNDAERNITFNCQNDLNHLKNALLKKDEFALKFYEANAKDHTGILSGLDGDLGDFDRCLSIQSPTIPNYVGKYCLISVQTALSNSVRQQEVYRKNLVGLSEQALFSMEFNLGTIYGLCVPNSCNIQDLLNSINKETSRYGINVIGQADRHCSSNDSTHNYKPLNWLEITCLAIVSTFVGLCMLAFYYENSFLNFFSIKRNLKKIYRIPENYGENEFNFIHGLKAIYVILSAGVHACGVLYLFSPFLYASFRNYEGISRFSKSMAKRLLIGPDIAVFIGGFLAIVAWQVVFSQKRANFVLYVFARFMRTIPIIISVLLLDRVWPLLGSGPYFGQLVEHQQKNCDRSFWKLFAFISNQDRVFDICQMPSWFIAVDVQLYILHYWTIKYLVQKPRFGLCLAFLQMICMSVYSSLDIYFNDLEPYFNSFNVYFYNTFRFERQYLITSIHSNSYTLGVLAGWLVINRKKIAFFESKLNRFIVFATACLCVTLSVHLPELFGDNNYLPLDNVPISIALSIWGSIYRILYLSLFLCVFYFMSLGYFKIGRNILSKRIMLPLSRLSFTIIMSQFAYLWYNIGTRKTHFRLIQMDLMKEAVWSVLVSLVIGHLVFAFLEAPIQNLLFCITGMDRKKARLKQDCSTARLSSEIQEQMFKEQANELFTQNKPKKNPSVKVVLFNDENSNTEYHVKAKFDC